MEPNPNWYPGWELWYFRWRGSRFGAGRGVDETWKTGGLTFAPLGLTFAALGQQQIPSLFDQPATGWGGANRKNSEVRGLGSKVGGLGTVDKVKEVDHCGGGVQAPQPPRKFLPCCDLTIWLTIWLTIEKHIALIIAIILMVLEMMVLEVMGHPDTDSYIIVLRHQLSASLIVRFLCIPLNTLMPNLDTSILQRLLAEITHWKLFIIIISAENVIFFFGQEYDID